MSMEQLNGPWRFRLVRTHDETGVSGTGHVATGIAFEDGACALRWRTSTTSTAVYGSVEDVEKIHGHNGDTLVEWIDPMPSDAMRRGAQEQLRRDRDEGREALRALIEKLPRCRCGRVATHAGSVPRSFGCGIHLPLGSTPLVYIDEARRAEEVLGDG